MVAMKKKANFPINSLNRLSLTIFLSFIFLCCQFGLANTASNENQDDIDRMEKTWFKTFNEMSQKYFKSFASRLKKQAADFDKINGQLKAQKSALEKLDERLTKSNNKINLFFALIFCIFIPILILFFLYLRRKLKVRDIMLKKIDQIQSDIVQLVKKVEGFENKSHQIKEKSSMVINKTNFQEGKEILSLIEKLEKRLQNIQSNIQSYEPKPQNLNSRTENSLSPAESELSRTDNYDLQKLVHAYEACENEEEYVPVSEIAKNLTAIKAVKTTEGALNLIDRLARVYPQAIRMGRMRGKYGNQLAIYL